MHCGPAFRRVERLYEMDEAGNLGRMELIQVLVGHRRTWPFYFDAGHWLIYKQRRGVYLIVFWKDNLE